MATFSLTQAPNRFRFLGQLFAKGVEKRIRAAAIAADQTLVLGTPVDSGRARSNWLVSIDAPNTSTVQPYSPGNELGIGERGNALGAFAQADLVIKRYKIGKTIFITNNLPYIDALNDGLSPQNEGFIEDAVDAANAALRSAKKIF